MPKQKPTQERLKELFSYDRETGIFTRKSASQMGPKDRKYGRQGAGRITELGYVLVMVDGINYNAGILAWVYETGVWPPGCLRYINGNGLDNRAANLRVQIEDADEIKAKPMTQERLKELLHYEQASGHFTWRINTSVAKPGERAGSFHGLGYRTVGLDYKKYLEHTLAWLYMTGEMPPGEIDHINGSRADNRWANLRLATRSQNCHNKPNGRGGSLGFPGVSKHGNAYLSRLELSGAKYNFGRHKTIAQARIARLLGEKRVLDRFTTWMPERDSRIPNGDGTFVTLEIRDGELFVDGKRPWSTPQVAEIAA